MSLPRSFISPDVTSPAPGLAWVSAAALYFTIQRAGTESRGLEELGSLREEARSGSHAFLFSSKLTVKCSGQWYSSGFT